MSDKFFIGMDVTAFDQPGRYKPVSRVTLLLDDDNALTAGDDTGRELVASCPHATQGMVNAILAKVKGYQYTPFNAGAANLDPAAELGDGITVSGVYSVVARLEDDGEGYPDVSAPGEAEMEDEYPAAGPMTQEFNRKLGETRSLISKTAEEIKLMVENEVSGLSSSINIKLDSITQTVTGLNGQVSSIEQYVDSLTLDVSNGSTSSTITLKAGSATIASQDIQMSGLVTYTGLSSGTTTIDGGCIQTGLISARRLDLTGAITFSDLSKAVQNDINDAYTMAEDAQQLATDVDDTVGGWTYRGTTYIDGAMLKTGTVMASSIQGGEVLLLDSRENEAASFTLSGAASYSGRKLVIDSGAIEINAAYGSLYLEGGSGAYIDIDDVVSIGGDLLPSGGERWAIGSNAYKWTDIYCSNGTIITSDREKKNSVTYDMTVYEPLFDALRPTPYKLNDGTSGRTHLGLIAQDVGSALTACGLTGAEFGGFVRSPRRDEAGAIVEGEYDYALRYMEFIPLLIWEVQKLKKRVSELEGQHG